MTPAKGYTEMKDSGIEWVGMIPAHWHIKVLFQLVSQVKSKNKNLSETNLLSLSYGKIKRKNIDDTEGLLPASFDGYNIIENNDIVLRLTDLQNDHTSLRVGRATERGIITSAYITIRPTNSRMSEYLYYLLHSFDIKKGFYGMGSGVRHGLNYDEVKMLKLPLPPLLEQSAIAAYLDTQCAKIDEIIAQAKDSIEDYKQWKASIIYEAVTKGLDPNVEMKDSGILSNIKIPAHWNTIRMKFVSTISGRIGFRGYTTQDLVDAGEGAITLSPSNIKDSGMSYDKCSYISWDKYYESPEIMAKNGDILFVKTGSSYGKSALVEKLPTEATINPQLVLLKNTKGVRPKYLFYFLQSPLAKVQIEFIVSGGTIPTMSQEKMRNFALPYPSVKEQNEISLFLDKQCTRITELIAEKQSLIDDLESYKKSLIYEVVTGKRRVC